MKHIISRVCLLWMFFYFFSLAALAQEPAKLVVPRPTGPVAAETGSGQKYAIIIGINNYIDPDIGRLNYAVADAEAIRSLLISPSGGFQEKNVFLLTDNAKNPNYLPTHSNILAQVRKDLEIPHLNSEATLAS